MVFIQEDEGGGRHKGRLAHLRHVGVSDLHEKKRKKTRIGTIGGGSLEDNRGTGQNRKESDDKNANRMESHESHESHGVQNQRSAWQGVMKR